MPIKRLTVANFKGIARRTEFDIRPITIFVGPNSSGKSSCIHALTSLGQTLKLGNSAPAIVLDDDFAQVHLGRFVEIAHSHSYSDPITIGIDIGDRPVFIPGRRRGEAPPVGAVRAEYDFKSTMRTQEVYVDAAKVAFRDTSFAIKRGAKSPYKFTTTEELTKRKHETMRSNNFLFQLVPTNPPPGEEEKVGWFEPYWLFDAVQREIEGELRGVRYLGPFRQPPLRRYPFRGATASEVGAQGEATITMLASEFLQTQDRTHARRINRWLSEMGLAKSLELSRVGSSDLFDVSFKLADGNKLPIADLGYGLSQVLPVITQCSFAAHGSTLLFEQPELHLHQGAATKLASVFLETAHDKAASLLIETHSKELVFELLQSVKAGALPPGDLAIYTVQRVGGESQYRRVRLEWDGEHLEVDDDWVRGLLA